VGGAPAARPTGARPGPAKPSAGAGLAAPAGAGGGAGCCLPSVEVLALDPSAAKWNIGGVHGVSTGAFEVRRSGHDLTQPLTVAYTLSPDSNAVAGVDYVALSGSITIPAGQRGAGFLVTPLDNASTNAFTEVGIVLSASPDYTIDGGAGNAWVQLNKRAVTYPQPHVEYYPVPQVFLDSPDFDWAAAVLPDGTVSAGAMLLWRGAYVYPWETDTNTAAVTVPYAVSGDPGAGADDVALPGSASLGRDVFAAVVPVVPVNNPNREGPVDVFVAPTPSPDYQVIVYSGVAVEIYPTAPADGPVAYDDTYALSADDVSLTIPADGVLCNDVSYADEPLTAGPGAIATALGGSVQMNPDGGFTYTPSAGLRATGGTDSFTYTASYTDRGGVLHTAAATAFINVVKMSLTLPNGPWVPVNANNDNGSAFLKPEIPTTRDFDIRGPYQNGASDSELMPVAVSLPPGMQLNGQFVIRIDQAANGGQVRLWTNDKKAREITSGMTFTQATLPRTFYIEGINPTVAVPVPGAGYDPRPDVKIWLTYFALNPQQFNVQIGAASADVEVTPVITRFDMNPGVVNFVQGQPIMGGPTFVIGMQAQANGPGQPSGMTIDTVLDRHNLDGDMIYVQNAGIPGQAWAIVNDQGLGRGGIRSTGGPSLDVILKDVSGTVYLQTIDRPGQGHQPGEPPDYYTPGHPELTPDSYAPSAGFVERYAYDFPGQTINANPANDAYIRGLTDFSIEFNFRMYVVWRFPGQEPEGDTVIYTVGTRDWHVVFRFHGTQPGFNPAGSTVEPLGDFDPTNHFNPIVVGPDFNDLKTLVIV
jgi:hypothetical protein